MPDLWGIVREMTAWNPDAHPEDPDHWSRVLGANYTADACKHCRRHRVLHYAEVNRFICEKCNWDQAAEDYATDHRLIG